MLMGPRGLGREHVIAQNRISPGCCVVPREPVLGTEPVSTSSWSQRPGEGVTATQAAPKRGRCPNPGEK